MLDHAFFHALAAVRRALEGALLERRATEERLQYDLLLGDVTWETTYTLPGEDAVPRVAADVTLVWSAWSQAAYRSWTSGLGLDEPPEVDVELVLRLQRLAARPSPDTLAAVLPEDGPYLGGDPLERGGVAVEEEGGRWAVEVPYGGLVALEEGVLEDEARYDEVLAPLGGWLVSTLVRLADLDLAYLRPDPEEDEA